MTRLYYLLITKVGDNVIFESAVILEYIDEVYPPATLPVNALERADNRAWGVFAGELQGTFITLWKSKNKADIQPTIEQGQKLFQLLEDRLNPDNHFFNGQNFSIVDAVYAPLFNQLRIYQQILKVDFYQALPKVKHYANNLLAHKPFLATLVPNYDQIALNDIQSFEAAILQQ